MFREESPDKQLRTDTQATGELGESALTRTIIEMGKSLDQEVVAEGIETREQKEYLRQHHCDEGQGFLFSYPLPTMEFAHLITSGIKQPFELFAS